MTQSYEKTKPLLFFELSELNFDVVSFYIERGKYFSGFKKLIEKSITHTGSEPEYENLEPCVQ